MQQIQPTFSYQLPIAGVYVVAVSGGVDSVVLLELLRRQTEAQLIVAHFDHGIREESRQDRIFVQQLAEKYGLNFEYDEGHLGEETSEATARKARYNFLQNVRKKYNAQTIITAHHQDDVYETILLNLIRGTGWRGLASLRSTPSLLRPLLDVPKATLVTFAQKQGLAWHEDRTNQDLDYTRNAIRQQLIPLLERRQSDAREVFLALRQQQLELLNQIDTELAMHPLSKNLPRYQLLMAPKPVALELLRQALVGTISQGLERPRLERALLFCKVGRVHKIHHLDANWQLRAGTHEIYVEHCRRLG